MLCRNVIKQHIQLSLSAIQLVNSRIMATSKSVDALLVRGGLCAVPGFLSCGSKIGKRTHPLCIYCVQTVGSKHSLELERGSCSKPMRCLGTLLVSEPTAAAPCAHP